MSDGLDPRHGPYRGKPKIDLDEWVHELTYHLIKRGAIKDAVAVTQVTDEIKGFAEQVVRATRDGHFTEVS